MESGKEKQIFVDIENTVRKIREGMNKIIKKYPVTFDQWLILEEILNKQGISQKIIASNTGKDEASVSRIVNKLRKLELVVSKKSLSNKKFLKLYLSPEGLEMSKELQQKINTHFKHLFNNVHDREYLFLNEILIRLNKSATA